MLAALETLTSLEPDYSDDLAAEASVTIIEAAGYDAIADALAARSRRRPPVRSLLRQRDEPPKLLLNGYETFVGRGRRGDDRDRRDRPFIRRTADRPVRRLRASPRPL